jgi:dienelactone hydrolase
MLVCFHKFGNSAYDILYNTNFFREGINRGWHVVAPLGASTAHFSSLESQVNTEAVMNWMVNPNHFSVDKTRVYAVGFSMGGGAALNYAARHLDPAKVMFAAVVNHTGVVCHEDAYDNEPLSQYIFEFWFGNGTPGYTDPFKMRRSSVITFDPVTLAVETTTDLARNLMHLNTRTLYANQDPLDYLRTENDVLHTHLLSLGAGPAQHVLYVYPGTTHSWDLLDEKITCDWLRTQRLRLPTSGNTLADQNGKYFYFTVTQALGGAFTPFAWELNTTSNTLDISQTANLVELAVDTALSGLSSSAPFTAELSTADGAPDALRLRGWNHLPWSVIRDGVPTSNWSYNATNGDLTLNEFNGAGVHVWLVVP